MNEEKYTLITKGDLTIGYSHGAPYRKMETPYLYVKIGNEAFYLAPFSNEGKAEFFFDMLCEMLGVKDNG